MVGHNMLKLLRMLSARGSLLRFHEMQDIPESWPGFLIWSLHLRGRKVLNSFVV